VSSGLRLSHRLDPLEPRGFKPHLSLPWVSRFGDGNVQLFRPVANGISATLHFDGNFRNAQAGGRQRSQRSVSVVSQGAPLIFRLQPELDPTIFGQGLRLPQAGPAARFRLSAWRL
jgi:hypothetical protein